jgi:hypothetical protein
MKQNQNGFAYLALILFLIVLVSIGATSYNIATKNQSTEESQILTSAGNDNNVTTSCPEPVLQSPVDISKITSVLYPGQTRGGNYKPHGGFRLDNSSSNDVEVRAPIDAKLVAGSRYIERGEEQILLYFQSACGVNFRFDHLLVVSHVIQEQVNRLPPAKPDDSRTTNLDDQLSVKAGDVIATTVGFKKTNNVAFDFGVYDTRQPNAASKDATYRATHPDLDSNEQLKYAVCWLDMFAESENKALKSLPAADQVSGKTSDYCK